MSTDILTCSDAEILKIADQLCVGYRLKQTLRYAGTRDFATHGESVAEHVFALLYLAQYFLPLEDPEGVLDVIKVHQILLFHDFGEMVNGDIPYHLKTKEHEAQERVDAEKVFASLPPEVVRIGHESWREYDERSSPEACFGCALDKIEPLFELRDPTNERSMRRLKFTYQAHIEKKLRATENFPVMRRFVDAMSNDMLARDVFWVNE